MPKVIFSILLFLSVFSISFAAVDGKSGVYFIGHLVPDTDSIFSAVAAAEYYGGIAARTGELNLAAFEDPLRKRAIMAQFGVVKKRP
ncbi:MAG: hypothetical protein WA705_19265 [Candidatus Ozemobacteraceae bacterium]